MKTRSSVIASVDTLGVKFEQGNEDPGHVEIQEEHDALRWNLENKVVLSF